MLRFMASHILVVDPTVHLSKRPTVTASSGRLSLPTVLGGGGKDRHSKLIVKL
jgi:hypothetical protein